MPPKKGTEAYERWKGSDSYKKFCKNKQGKNHPQFRKDITKEMLYQKYVIEKKDSYKIAKELNTSENLVWRRLKQYGIPTRTISEAKKGKPNLLNRKTLEEKVGKKKAKILKENISKSNKGKIPLNKGKTWEEYYGKEKADKMREKLSKSRKGKCCGKDNHMYGRLPNFYRKFNFIDGKSPSER